MVEEEEMREAEHIRAAYRQGDLRQRLNLFLEYRDLRSDFTKIEAEETVPVGGSSKPVGAGRKAGRGSGFRPRDLVSGVCRLLLARVTPG